MIHHHWSGALPEWLYYDNIVYIIDEAVGLMLVSRQKISQNTHGSVQRTVVVSGLMAKTPRFERGEVGSIPT